MRMVEGGEYDTPREVINRRNNKEKLFNFFIEQYNISEKDLSGDNFAEIKIRDIKINSVMGKENCKCENCKCDQKNIEDSGKKKRTFYLVGAIIIILLTIFLL